MGGGYGFWGVEGGFTPEDVSCALRMGRGEMVCHTLSFCPLHWGHCPKDSPRLESVGRVCKLPPHP